MEKEQLIEELKEMYSDSENYLKEYIKDNEEGITSINEFENCIDSEEDMYIVRVWDLAQMEISKRLLNKLNK